MEAQADEKLETIKKNTLWHIKWAVGHVIIKK